MTHKKHGAHRHGKKEKATEAEGVIAVTRSGKGFVAVAGFDEDIEIPRENLGTALSGDTVRIGIAPRKVGRRHQGAVREVLARKKIQFVGVLEKRGDDWFLVPDDRRVYAPLLLDDLGDKKPKQGHKGVARLREWNRYEAAGRAELLDILGEAGMHETEMHAIVREQGFDTSFPPDVEREAAGIRAQKEELFMREAVGREDFRDRTTFTIDPDDAKDFDDAISVRELSGGALELGVHIADVSAWVPEGGAIDREAMRRGTSVYLVDRTIHMLPEVLAADACSLRPGEDKLAFSALFELTPDFNITSQRFARTIIKSDKRFTYGEAQALLESRGEGALGSELLRAADVARHLRKARMAAGSVAFETDEVGFTLDAKGVPIAVFKKKRHKTMEVIEDLMLLANRAVAEYMTGICKARGGPCPFIYRVHDLPKPERIEELSIFLEALGLALHHEKGLVKARDINALLASVEGRPEEELVETATVRSMAKAVYATKNIGHFGLAFKHYTHFTSPIRRYPDLLVHRSLAGALRKETPGTGAYERLTRLAQACSEREAAAAEAERESVKLKQVEYMAGRVGETFLGIVTGVAEWGLYIEEVETLAEGLAHISTLGGDFYNLRGKYQLVGERSRKVYSLGDRVRMGLVAADIEQKQLTWKVLA